MPVVDEPAPALARPIVGDDAVGSILGDDRPRTVPQGVSDRAHRRARSLRCRRSGALGALIPPERFLSSSIIGSLPVTPDFVFFNCCHLGHIDTVPTGRIAASVAKTVMEHGVRAVVAAGWAVDDTDAMEFATTLYECLCAGPYGEAVRRGAAKKIYREDGPTIEHLGRIPVLWRAGWRLAQRPGERAAAGDSCSRATRSVRWPTSPRRQERSRARRRGGRRGRGWPRIRRPGSK